MVFTTSVEPPVGTATLPAGAEPQLAGVVVELQFDRVETVPKEIVPGTVVVTPARPILTVLAVVEPIESVPAVRVSNPKPLAAILIKPAKKSPFTWSTAVGALVPMPTLLLMIMFCPERPKFIVVACVVPKFKTPLVTESISEPICRKRFPLVPFGQNPNLF